MKFKSRQNKMNIKFVICFFSFLFIIGNVRGQVTIGSGIEPAKGVLLDMKVIESLSGGVTSTKGVVFPRVSLDSLSSLTPLLSDADAMNATQKTTHKGTIVYNVNVSPTHKLVEGFYYWDATKWIKMLGIINEAWLTTGNTGTDSTTNFVGTTDRKPLVFKVNNERSGYISNVDEFKNYTSFGYKALSGGNTGEANVAFGYQALLNNTTGAGNTAFGMNALAANTTGGDNTAVGNRALANSTGIGNTAVGSSSMMANNMTGSGNVGVGQNALQFVVSGGDNTGIGTGSLLNNINGWANTSVGNNALRNNLIGSNNTALGAGSLNLFGEKNAPAGENNTAVGKGAGSRHTAGNNNIFLGVETQVPDTIGSNQMNIGNAIFGKNMTGTVTTPAGNIGIRTNNPTQPFHVNTLVGGVKTPIRLDGLPNIPSGAAANQLIIDSVGNVYQSRSAASGQILRMGINGATYSGGTESSIRLRTDASSGKAPNNANNYIQTISGSSINFGVSAASGPGAPTRTTDQISLPPGVYQVTVRLVGSFSGTAADNTVFIKAIVNNSEYSLNNNVQNSNESGTIYFLDFIIIEGTTSQTLDFTLQTKPGTQNSYTTQASSQPAGSSGNSIRSMVLIQRLR
jgi:hypothetical protein